MPALLDSVKPVINSCQAVTSALVLIIPKNQFWRWKDMWSNSMRTAAFAAVLIEYLSNRSLLSLEKVSDALGSESNHSLSQRKLPITNVQVKPEWSDRLSLPVEDYLHALITVVNELVCCHFIVTSLPLKLKILVVSPCRQCSDLGQFRRTSQNLGIRERPFYRLFYGQSG